MRKSRLVILPTKCLNQIGFLLLFLSCPVIGDWGRIRPETEASHKSVQIAREGTCGLQRDLPGGLSTFSSAKDIEKYRNLDSYNSGRNYRQKRANENTESRVSYRNIIERGEETRRENRQMPIVRSESLRRIDVVSRGEGTVRSRSLTRLDQRKKEPTLKNIRNTPARGEDESNRQSRMRMERKAVEAGRINERRNQREREVRANLRREDSRMERVEDARRWGSRSRDARREATEENSASVNRRNKERMENPERRDMRRFERSTSRRESQDERRIARSADGEARNGQRFENKMRQMPENRQQRREGEATRRAARRIENPTGTRNSHDGRRVETRTEAGRRIERQVRGENKMNVRMPETGRKVEIDREVLHEAKQVQIRKIVPKADYLHKQMEDQVQGKDKFFNEEFSLTSLNSKKVGEWTLNCVIGAAAYYLTTKQVKTV